MPRMLADREDEKSLWLLVEKANQLLEAEISSVLEPLDLTIELLKVLYVVDDCDGGTIGDLEAASSLGPERVASGVRALQMRGLVTRAKPKEDPETTVIRFTTEGRQKARRAHVAVQRTQERAGGWLGTHRAPLIAALERLSKLPDVPRPVSDRT